MVPGSKLKPGPYYDKSRVMSCNNVIRLEEEPELTVNNGTFATGIFDNRADWHVLYLHSDLQTFKSSGPRKADRDVIARIPCTVAHGFVEHYSPYKMIVFPVTNISLKTLTFWLTHSSGEVVDLHGGNVSIE